MKIIPAGLGYMGDFSVDKYKCIEYIDKCKMLSTVKKFIDYINENPRDYQWLDISSNLSVNEIKVPLPNRE
ncbi:hypothetical protein LL033_08355 [Clostridium estertheticum]|uniref:hypothetical protein n=1 Tax=Clostridium estertheticum TaxID=238834 RepID=UPI001C0B3961|nr:hypothetical protein [Clostridium estertheticum]MBU3214820.1 hypothetical protein [Clostridium estertheticum]WAG57228.1 hypothetical protein LL033_08355 [Clostridium estertheticum]